MEFTSDNRTPLDRLDKEFLEELLDDNESQCAKAEVELNKTQGCHHHKVCANSRTVINNHKAMQNNDINCSHGKYNELIMAKLIGFPLAMVYSPFQEWDDIYESEVGFERGTIFKKLDLPFNKASCGSENRTKYGK